MTDANIRRPPTGWIFTSLRGYRMGWLPGDLVAGLMLAAIAIPGQLATARLAGMPPQTGLYAFAAGSFAFAAFGANRFMSVAADSTIAPIFAGGLASIAVARPAHYTEMATLLALLVGIVLVAVGLLRAGWLATLLSIPVTTGFLAGISIHIIVGELPIMLGVAGWHGHLLVRLVHTFGQLRDTNLYTRWHPDRDHGHGADQSPDSGRPYRAGRGRSRRGPIPFRGARRQPGRPLSVPLPRLAIPPLPGMDELGHMFQLALVVAMVCIMQTAAVASTFPSDDGTPDDVSRDFAGVGAGSILAGLIGAFAVDSSPPSTAIVRESGGHSQIASLTAVALMVALTVLAAGLMAYVPHAALSGILVYIALRIFGVGEMIQIYRRSGPEILLVVASAGLVIALPIETGMLLAIVLSFVHSLYAVARPYCAELARVPGSTVWWPPARGGLGEHEAGVLVFAPAAPLNFTNTERICGKIKSAIAAQHPPVLLLVIEANGIIDIDYTGAQILRRVVTELRATNIVVALARLSDERAQAHRTGLIDTIGPDRVFMSVEEAVRKLGPNANLSNRS
ncbi:MAG: SulP family inorganic anion transporter [Rhodopila sp.]|jgi:MFS superfamily sulfate permease-like transporter|nr:SulP family inorganic anion transporter [Rhodopila sp.]